MDLDTPGQGLNHLRQGGHIGGVAGQHFMEEREPSTGTARAVTIYFLVVKP
jgi:hypothetical protein